MGKESDDSVNEQQAAAGRAMAAMITSLDQSKRIFDQKSQAIDEERVALAQEREQYHQKIADLQAYEAELNQYKGNLSEKERALELREENIGTLESKVRELEEELQKKPSAPYAVEVSGSIEKSLANYSEIQAKHTKELEEKDRIRKESVAKAISDTEAKYLGPDGLLTKAQASIKDFEALVRAPAPVTSLETTLSEQERPTREPGKPLPDVETIKITQTPDDLYEAIANKAKETSMLDRKQRYSKLVKQMQNRGVGKDEAIKIVTDAIQAEVFEEKVAEHIVEKGQELDRKIAYLRAEIEEFEDQKERLSALEAREESIKQKEAENLNLADALDKKEEILLRQQAVQKNVAEIFSIADRYLNALKRGGAVVISTCHTNIKGYEGRLHSLVTGGRNIGATGAAMILLPAYAGNLLLDPVDPDLECMIADKDRRPQLYFTVGEGDASAANRLAGKVKDSERYHIGKQEDGTFYVSSRGNTEGGTAIAYLAAWGIKGEQDGELSEKQKKAMSGAAQSIMYEAVLADYTNLHTYTVKLNDILNVLETLKGSIKPQENLD